jgi:hypothetical protein
MGVGITHGATGTDPFLVYYYVHGQLCIFPVNYFWRILINFLYQHNVAQILPDQDYYAQ